MMLRTICSLNYRNLPGYFSAILLTVVFSVPVTSSAQVIEEVVVTAETDDNVEMPADSVMALPYQHSVTSVVKTDENR